MQALQHTLIKIDQRNRTKAAGRSLVAAPWEDDGKELNRDRPEKPNPHGIHDAGVVE
jgi:hypothetical protein